MLLATGSTGGPCSTKPGKLFGFGHQFYIVDVWRNYSVGISGQKRLLAGLAPSTMKCDLMEGRPAQDASGHIQR
ncbi:hypothetical protein HPB48_011469 [Haemaphysalis longicornis]|uniref:Uncharacterized protein n=1 Tax=Haemaphysalis longicornis TaxID=44386 RepID=A0A9J6GS50_HAELO|nr:hypothetical protein HPB48_011469 [Haemaphysalis longicornis]